MHLPNAINEVWSICFFPWSIFANISKKGSFINAVHFESIVMVVNSPISCLVDLACQTSLRFFMLITAVNSQFKLNLQSFMRSEKKPPNHSDKNAFPLGEIMPWPKKSGRWNELYDYDNAQITPSFYNVKAIYYLMQNCPVKFTFSKNNHVSD